MPPSPSADPLARVRSHATCSIADASALLGLSTNTAYILARAGHELAPGIRAFKVGDRKLAVPSAPLLRLLGREADVEALFASLEIGTDCLAKVETSKNEREAALAPKLRETLLAVAERLEALLDPKETP